jgi:hypothetical protein
MVSQRQTLYRSGIQYREAETKGKSIMIADKQRQKCFKNIKLGDTFLLKDHMCLPTADLSATIIAYSPSSLRYLFGSNHQGQYFWPFDRRPGGDPYFYKDAQQSHNFNDFKFAYWYSFDELEGLIIKRIK